MVSLEIHLLALILLISEAYCQLAGCGGSPQPQRYAATPSIISGGQFIVPAVIKPLMPTACQPTQPASKKQPSQCADDDADSELDKLLYLLISNIIESKKGSGKKQSSGYDSNTGSCDSYDACACSYGDDYDYCSYPAPVLCGSGGGAGGDGYCPEISVYIRPASDSK